MYIYFQREYCSKSCISFDYFLIIFNILNNQNQFELPYLYWIPKFHRKILYEQRYIAGLSKCSAKPFLFFISKISSAVVKEELQDKCAKVYSRSGVNQTWILKNSKEFLKIWNPTILLKSIETKHTTFVYFLKPPVKAKARLLDYGG